MALNIKADEQTFLDVLEQLVRAESPTGDLAALASLAELLDGLLSSRGWQVSRHSRDGAGDHLEARLDGGDGESTLLLCHYDTVWPVGTLADMPLKDRKSTRLNSSH